MTRERIGAQWYSFTGPGGRAGVRGGWNKPYPWTVYFRDRSGRPVAPTAIPGNEIPVTSYREAVARARAHCERRR